MKKLNFIETLSFLRWSEGSYSGLSYAERTEGRPIFYRGEWIGRPIQKGNRKLDRFIDIGPSLLAGVTCPNCRDCFSSCYAKKAENLYPNVSAYRAIWTYIAQNDLGFFCNSVVTGLRKSQNRLVRLHVSGDFFSDSYVQAWAEIAKKFPEKKFFGYTKADRHVDLRPLDRLDNVNIVQSILPDGEKNFARKGQEFQELLAKYPAFPVCPYSIQWKEKAVCGVSCHHCLTSRHVLFQQH